MPWELAMTTVGVENHPSPRVHRNAVHRLPFMEGAHWCWLVATEDDPLTETFPTAKIAETHNCREIQLIILVGVRDHGVRTFTLSNHLDARRMYTGKEAPT